MHLPDHQFLVQPIRAGEEEELAALGFEELFAEPDKPILPEWLGGG